MTMVIVVDFGDDVQRYAEQFAGFVLPQLPPCPQCAVSGHVIGHGSYPRTVSEPPQTIAIRVKRVRCATCQHTFALLPTFCLPFRHYATATMQTVLSVRCQAQASWSQICQHFVPSDLPTRTTCREWVAAFRQASRSYLAVLVHQLATWPRRSVTLEVVLGDLGTLPTPAVQLIAAVPHLLNWLATLWQWGNGAKLGRLV
jgi:hypothetical protein